LLLHPTPYASSILQTHHSQQFGAFARLTTGKISTRNAPIRSRRRQGMIRMHVREFPAFRIVLISTSAFSFFAVLSAALA
jgi:hypothetical protein